MSEEPHREKVFDPPWINPSYYCHALPTQPNADIGTVLVTGASGYIGRRLVPELLVRGYKVRIMLRADSPEFQELWPNVEVVVADALDKKSLNKAMIGVDTAYYLMHSVLLGLGNFEESEKQAPINFREAAEENAVKRIIYLGGKRDDNGTSSRFKQRMKVVKEIQSGSVPATILKSSMIIGPGSASYEILKNLVSVLPVILAPKWAKNKFQPISVSDVVRYLVGTLETPEMSGQTFDICGGRVLTYIEMMRILAKLHNLKRIFIHTPFSNTGIYSYIAGLLTPVPTPITRFMIENMRNNSVCTDNKISKYINIKLMTFQAAVLKAMSRAEQDRIYSRWTDAYPPAHELAIKLHEINNCPFYTAKYSIETTKSAKELFTSVCKIGGKDGWFANNWMWSMRGFLDRVVFGVGTTRGRKSQNSLRINSVIGFWRVEDYQPGKRLLLRAEMKLPGKAWLEFSIEDKNNVRTVTAIPYFCTQTFWGRAYWYVFVPFHEILFNDLIKQIEKRS